MDGNQSKDEKEVSYCPTRLAERRCAVMSKPFGGGLLSRGNRFSSGKADTGDKPPRVQSVPIPLYRNSEATS